MIQPVVAGDVKLTAACATRRPGQEFVCTQMPDATLLEQLQAQAAVLFGHVYNAQQERTSIEFHVGCFRHTAIQ